MSALEAGAVASSQAAPATGRGKKVAALAVAGLAAAGIVLGVLYGAYPDVVGQGNKGGNKGTAPAAVSTMSAPMNTVGSFIDTPDRPLASLIPAPNAVGGIDGLISILDAVVANVTVDPTGPLIPALDTTATGDKAPATCNPTTAAEFVAAIQNKCSYIKIAAGANIVFPKGTPTLIIEHRVAIVGDPVNRPWLDARAMPRFMEIRGNGYLDMRFMRVYRGGGTTTGNRNVTIAGFALIHSGAGASFLGCLIASAIPAQPDFKVALTIGGHFLVVSGVLRFTFCQFANLTPYHVRIPIFFGGDTVMGLGLMMSVGCQHLQWGAVLAGGGAGVFDVILGGVGIYSGTNFQRLVGFNAAGSVGVHVFIGGGVGIFSGVTFGTNGAFFSFYGMGVHQFNGGGVMINTGVISNQNFAIANGIGTGPFYSQGAGVHVSSGCTYSITVGIQYINFYGGQMFQGSGTATYTGCSWSRIVSILGAWGYAGTAATASGNLEATGNPKAAIQSILGLGYLGGGWLVFAGQLMVNASPYFRGTAISMRLGGGNNGWVGAGALQALNTPDFAKHYLTFQRPNPQPRWVCKTGSLVIKNSTPNPGRKLQEEEVVNPTVLINLQSYSMMGEPDAEFHTKLLSGETLNVASKDLVCAGNEYVFNTVDTKCYYKDVSVIGCPDDDSYRVCEQVASVDEAYEKAGLPAPGTEVEEEDDEAGFRRNLQLSGASSSALTGAAASAMSYILRMNLKVSCMEGYDCQDAKIMTSALQELMGKNVKLSVIKDAVDPMIAEWAPASAKETDSGDAECPGLAKFQVFVVSNSMTGQSKAQNKMSAFSFGNEETASSLGADLASVGVDGACKAGFEAPWTMNVPLEQNFKNAGASAAAMTNAAATLTGIAPALVLRDNEGEKGLTSVVPGETVQVSFANFPQGQLLFFRLMGGPQATTAGAPIGSVMARSNSGTFRWKVPTDLLAGEGYFLQAAPVNKPDLVATTAALSVVTRARV